MTSLIIQEKYNYCVSNYEASKCFNLLQNKNQTLEFYNLCYEEMYQDEAFKEASVTGQAASDMRDCDVYK